MSYLYSDHTLIIIMSTTDSSKCPTLGEFSWNELVSPDTAGSAQFYSRLFGWQTALFVPPGTPAGGPPYTLFKVRPDDMGVGGMMASPGGDVPAQWIPYVVVADANASIAKVAELGGTVLLPPMDVGSVGRIAVFRDPQGAVLGLHQPPA